MAQKVRIYPYSQYDRTVCLRAELIGCIWDGEFCFPLFFLQFIVLALKTKTFLASEKRKLYVGVGSIDIACASRGEIAPLVHIFFVINFLI